MATMWSSCKTSNEPLEEMQARLKLAIHGIEPSLKRRFKSPLKILGDIDLDA